MTEFIKVIKTGDIRKWQHDPEVKLKAAVAAAKPLIADILDEEEKKLIQETKAKYIERSVQGSMWTTIAWRLVGKGDYSLKYDFGFINAVGTWEQDDENPLYENDRAQAAVATSFGATTIFPRPDSRARPPMLFIPPPDSPARNSQGQQIWNYKQAKEHYFMFHTETAVFGRAWDAVTKEEREPVLLFIKRKKVTIRPRIRMDIYSERIANRINQVIQEKLNAS